MTTRMKGARALLGFLALAGLLGLRRTAEALEVVPMVGVNVPDRNGADYDPGLHLGVSVGLRAAPVFSLHGDLHFNLLNGEDTPDDWSAWQLSISVAPLFHVLSGRDLRLALGPTFGWFYWEEEGEVLGVELGGDAHGFALGLQMAVLFPLRRGPELGPVLTYRRLFVKEICGEAFGITDCDVSPDDQDADVLTFGLAVWF